MRRLTIILVVMLVATIDAAAKDWRGLLPMHSTRTDVKNLLGSATGLAMGDRWVYTLEGANVLFMFADKAYLETNDCDEAVAEGTLLAISVRPKNQMTLASLNLGESTFRRFNPADTNTDLVGLVDEQQGIVARVAPSEFVEEVVYIPLPSDRPRCPKFFSRLEDFVKIVLQPPCGLSLDQYGNIRFEDEKARLDNFAIQLENEPDTTGYIIVYAGQKAVVAEARLRGERARNYLINVRKVDPTRVKAIDGGYQADFTVYLRIVPAGAEPPIPAGPTIDPKDVEIIYPKKRRPRSRNE